MADLQVTNVFGNGDVIDADRFNTNYSDIVTYVNARNSGSSTWDSMKSLSSTTVPLVADNSSGTQDIVNFKDNGTTVFKQEDGGVVTTSMQPYGRMTKGSSQVIAPGSDVLVTFSSGSTINTTFDGSSKLTVPSSGKYLINANLQAVPNVSGIYTIKVFKNGSVISSARYFLLGVFSRIGLLKDVVSLTPSDYIQVYINVAAGISNGSVGSNSFFELSKLS